MSKRGRPKKPINPTYYRTDRMNRWYICLDIAKKIFDSALQDVEIFDFRKKLGETPMVGDVLDKINLIEDDKTRNF